MRSQSNFFYLVIAVVVHHVAVTDMKIVDGMMADDVTMVDGITMIDVALTRLLSLRQKTDDVIGLDDVI